MPRTLGVWVAIMKCLSRETFLWSPESFFNFSADLRKHLDSSPSYYEIFVLKSSDLVATYWVGNSDCRKDKSTRSDCTPNLQINSITYNIIWRHEFKHEYYDLQYFGHFRLYNLLPNIETSEHASKIQSKIQSVFVDWIRQMIN